MDGVGTPKSNCYVIRFNNLMIALGPVIDDDLVPDLPSRLYTTGQHIKNITVMAGHNSNEVC